MKAAGRSASASTRRIPLPPPPAEAFSRIGYPAFPANAAISAWPAAAPRIPGTTGTPAFSMSCRLPVFDPIAAIASGVGPTKVRPASRQARAKPAFSARNP